MTTRRIQIIICGTLHIHPLERLLTKDAYGPWSDIPANNFSWRINSFTLPSTRFVKVWERGTKIVAEYQLDFNNARIRTKVNGKSNTTSVEEKWIFENLEEKENKFGRRAKNIQKQTSSHETSLEVEDNACQKGKQKSHQRVEKLSHSRSESRSLTKEEIEPDKSKKIARVAHSWRIRSERHKPHEPLEISERCERKEKDE